MGTPATAKTKRTTKTASEAASKAGARAAPKAARKAVPREGRRERNKREKQARIVAAARALFRAKGYDATTTQEIAEAADIGTGTLFLYAKSKEDLLVLVFLDEMSELIERVYRSIPGDMPLLEQAEALFDGFIAYHKRDIAIAQALIRELSFIGNPERREEVTAIPEAIVAKLVSFVEAAQTEGAVRPDIDAGQAGQVLFSLYYYNLQTWVGGFADDTEFRANLHDSLKFLVDNIASPSARRRKPAKAASRKPAKK